MTNIKTRRAAKAAKAIISEGPTAAMTTSLKGVFELGRETRGAIFVEYLTLVCVVILGGSAAVVSLGQPLVHLYRVTQLIVGLPIP